MYEVQQKITKNTVSPDNIAKFHEKHEIIEADAEELQKVEL